MHSGELLFELISEVFPVRELQTALVLREFFPLENMGCPLRRLSGLHVGHGPYYFHLLVMELFGAEVGVGLTGVKKCQTLFTISVKLWQGCRFWSAGLLGYRFGVGRCVWNDGRWGDGDMMGICACTDAVKFAKHFCKFRNIFAT